MITKFIGSDAMITDPFDPPTWHKSRIATAVPYQHLHSWYTGVHHKEMYMSLKGTAPTDVTIWKKP